VWSCALTQSRLPIWSGAMNGVLTSSNANRTTTLTAIVVTISMCLLDSGADGAIAARTGKETEYTAEEWRDQKGTPEGDERCGQREDSDMGPDKGPDKEPRRGDGSCKSRKKRDYKGDLKR
jgi:hypothetical protein